MKKTIALLALTLASNVTFAAPSHKMIGSITTTDITPVAYMKAELSEDDPTPKPTIKERVGDIIAMGKDIVALGEEAYTLVLKGKPVNTTEYAPISVVPKDPTTREPVSPFDLDNSSLPVDRTYKTVIKNLAGKEVVTFTYRLIYTYGASLDGVGKYLTNVQLVPAKVSTKFGWEFNATMKVTGVVNHGTKANPVAGVLINLKYTMNSLFRAEERNDTLHIAGNGQMKFYGVK